MFLRSAVSSPLGHSQSAVHLTRWQTCGRYYEQA